MNKLLLLLPLAALGCGSPLLYTGVSAKRLCIRKVGQQLPGTGLFTPVPVSGAVEDQFDLDVGGLPDLEDEKIDAKLGLLSFRLAADGGALAGLESLVVRLVPPVGADLPALTLVDHPASAGAQVSPGEVAVDLAPLGADLVPYVKAEQLAIQLEAAGTLPAEPWSATVEICTNADAEYDYGKELGL
jgi:hypothetical protein